MAHDAAKITATYFEAWKVNDFDTMRSLVDDDVTFSGPLARLNGVEDCRRSSPTSFSGRSSLTVPTC